MWLHAGASRMYEHKHSLLQLCSITHTHIISHILSKMVSKGLRAGFHHPPHQQESEVMTGAQGARSSDGRQSVQPAEDPPEITMTRLTLFVWVFFPITAPFSPDAV